MNADECNAHARVDPFKDYISASPLHGLRYMATARTTTLPSRGTALLLIDVINDLKFPGSAPIVEQASTLATKVADLKRRAAAARVPCIYVNDNFGRWQSDFRQTVAHCTATSSPGRRLSMRLKPTRRDYFVLKPKHSGFYDTTLDTLLEELRIQRVVLTGIAGNICVLFTANDAYMRGLKIVAAEDCIVSNKAEDNAHALRQIATVMKGVVVPAARVTFRPPRGPRGRSPGAL